MWAAFLIPFTIRAIPDLIAGPYPIGYDTISSYVPLMHAWASGGTASQLNPQIGGWLIFALFGLAYSATRIDPITIAKFAGPVIYGVLGFSEYVFAQRILKWDNRKALLLVFFASIYFVSLRMSLDLFRNTLGLALMLLTLAFGKDVKSNRGLLEFSALVFLVTLTHLLVATLLVSLVLIEALSRRGPDWKRVTSVLPAVAYFVISLVGFQNQGITVIIDNNPTVEPLSAYTFSVYIFLPLIPMAVLGARSLGSSLMRNWLVICSLGILVATTPLSVSAQLVSPDRWSLMMFLPLVALSTEGFSLLRRSIPGTLNWGPLIATAWLFLLLLLATTYVGLQAENAFPYYRYFGPSSMLQSSVPLRDSPDVVNSFQWLSSNIQTNSVIIAPNAVYGWASEYYTGKAAILTFKPGTTFDAMLQQALQQGYTTLYTVWWANGQGWYGQPAVPPGFSLEHQSRDFGVFEYRI